MNNRSLAAAKYGVTQRTISRWLSQYGLYKPKHNYGCNKLDMDKAREIRSFSKDGMAMKELSEKYKVTLSTISRVVHNLIYKDEKNVADVKVIYNPDPDPVIGVATPSP